MLSRMLVHSSGVDPFKHFIYANWASCIFSIKCPTPVYEGVVLCLPKTQASAYAIPAGEIVLSQYCLVCCHKSMYLLSGIAST